MSDPDDASDRQSDDRFAESALDSFTLKGVERYTMAEAAKLKGVSYHTVSRAVRQGRLPVVRLGRMALIGGEDLENWHPMRERAPARFRQAPEPSVVPGSVILDEALGERLEIARQLSTLFEVIHAASSELEMGAFGQLLSSRFSTIFGLSRVSMWVIDPQDRTAERIATVGPKVSSAPDTVDISSGYARLTSFIDPGNARVSLDPQSEYPDVAGLVESTPSGPILIVPLRVRGRTIGGMFGDRGGDNLALSQDQLSLAQVLGNQAALALDNAMLLKDQHFRNVQLSTILDHVRDLVRACDAKGRLTLINRADRLFDSEGADPESGSDAMENPEVLERRELDGSLIDREHHPLARALRGESVTDWEYRVTRVDGRVQLAQVSARPLYIDGEITGAVYIGRNITAQREAEQADRERVARIEQASARALAMADMVIHILMAPNARQAADIALDCLCTQLGDKAGLAWVVREDGGLEAVAARRFPSPLDLPAIHDPISISTTITAFARTSPLVVSVEEAGRSERHVMSLVNASALLVTPLQIDDEHLGAIYILHDLADRFDAEDLTFAATVGNQCAHAIDRIRLYKRLEGTQARLLGVIEQMPQAVLIVDAANGSITTANAAAGALWGMSLEEGSVRADSLPVLDLNGQPYAEDEHPLTMSIRTGERSVDELLTLKRDDGRLVDVIARHTPIIGADGMVVGSVSVLQDRAQFQLVDQSSDRFDDSILDE
ncbi:MAG: GAF domain-containing protein [Chloroflexia bacterium]|nr:GAF domain-containing protein [Chloroflexia bacterium]